MPWRVTTWSPSVWALTSCALMAAAAGRWTLAYGDASQWDLEFANSRLEVSVWPFSVFAAATTAIDHHHLCQY